jgi:SLT domain-containing protein
MQAGKAARNRLGAALRGLTCLSGLALLSACAGHAPQVASAPPIDQSSEAALYKARARANYTPPGPPSDPWGPYIFEASNRFDVPPTWIREVMHVESNGYQFRPTGELTTSPVGAMGLMQLMPETYDDMRARYGLGTDAYEPHDNILAGTAYLREMYDAFGTPGFLAAYNAGPNRLQAYLSNHGALPDETRRYVKIIGTRIAGTYPTNRSPAEQLALNQIPLDISRGLRWPPHRTYMVASRRSRHGGSVQVAYLSHRHGTYSHQSSAPVEVAEAPEPRQAAYTHVASAASFPHVSHGLHLIEPAMASDNAHLGGHDWSVQVGAYGNASQAHAAIGAARSQVGHSNVQVAAVHAGHGTLYRARLGGMSHDAAVAACHKLAHHGSCMIVSPASR